MGILTNRSIFITGATSYNERNMTVMFSQEGTDLNVIRHIQMLERQEVGEIKHAGDCFTFFQANHILMVSGSKTAS
ncbi:MAG TPA: hypothetical protein VF359_07350 [Anaerolineales bacterium]